MRKFIIIQDIRQCQCYSNINARLVYLHVACQVDVATYTCVKSFRQLARELDLSLGEVRHAVEQLQRDGLIATQVATQAAAQGTTHITTQPTTHITILKNNENGAPNGAPNNTPSNTPNNTPNNTRCDTQINKNNNINNSSHTVTDARARWIELQGNLASLLNLDEPTAGSMVADFRRRQAIKKKTWDSEGDLLAHLVAWCEKRIPKAALSGVKNARSDHEARVQERQRAKEEEAKETPDEKRLQEINKLRRWAQDARKNKREDLAAAFEDQARKMQEAV